jgi:hypothetical protein
MLTVQIFVNKMAFEFITKNLEETFMSRLFSKFLIASGITLMANLSLANDVAPTGTVPTAGATNSPKPVIHMIYMGGSDCPPCVAWRAVEFPKLEKSPMFGEIKFVFVNKVISSQVPARFFLPAEAKPFKDVLDEASGANRGSAQAAILVDGKVYDYWFGGRDASIIEGQIKAILSGTRSPIERCTKRIKVTWDCETSAKAW